MPKIVTAFFVVLFAALVGTLLYAGQRGMTLADLTGPGETGVVARANIWLSETWKKVSKGETGSLPQKPADAAAKGTSKESAKTAAASPADAGLSAAVTPPSAAESGEEPRIDVSRISPDGASVFAGTASPNETFTLFADDTPVAEIKTDDTGSWSVLTNHRFANLDPKLSLKRGQFMATASPKGTAPGEATADIDHQRVAANEAKDALKNFEAIVDEARRENDEKDAKAKAEGASGEQATAAASSGTEITAADASNAGTDDTNPALVKIPVPITFVYNSADLTENGAYAARLLVDYVRLKGLKSVSLTGHADERGSDAYNYELSRERLEAIAKILRDGGFDGRLQLIPKGKSEPYRGVDRNALPREALYQADRRVELKYVR